MGPRPHDSPSRRPQAETNQRKLPAAAAAANHKPPEVPFLKHLFIINPAAGKKDSTEVLLSHIKALDLDTELVLTAGQGDAERLARRAVERGEPMRIYACGGDGTLNEVVNAAAGHDHVAITNVPKGTGNDFLRIFGPDWRRGFSDLDALSRGPQAAFDLIDCNGKLGIGVACAGVDARIADDVHQYKCLPLVTGTGAYLLSLVVNVLFKGICRPTAVDLGEVHYDGQTAIICACNGRYYGGGFMPVGDAMPDDGVLDFLVVPKVSRFTFFRLVGQYAKGRYRDYPQVIYHWHGDRITFSSTEEIVAVVDGETVRGNTFSIGLSDRKVNFFWPEHLDYQVREAD